jgi:hypothetical protein
MKLKICFFLALLCACLNAQVSVAPSPVPEMQFFDANGNPLSGGRVFTYLAGTTTQENTYTDASGTSQNSDPIILDAAGFPANGTVRTGIFLANKSYKFVAQDQFGVIQWTADNVTGYLGLLNLSNIWSFGQTFQQPIAIVASDNQILFGNVGAQTLFDIPPSPSGTTTLHFQTAVNDFVVNRNSTDTLCCKTLTTPIINQGVLNTPNINGTQVINTPGTYITLPNDAVTGTFQFNLVKLTGGATSNAIVSSTSDTGGFLGIAVAGFGKTGNVTVQQSGLVPCQFDTATAANDYVQGGNLITGACRDAGASYPFTGQVIGRVLSTNAGAGTYQIDLFPPESRPAFYPQVVVSTGTAYTNGTLAPFTAYTYNGAGGAMFRVSGYITQGSAGTGCSTNSTITPFVSFTDPSAPGTASFSWRDEVSNATSVVIAGNGAANVPFASLIPINFPAKAASTISIGAGFAPGTCTVAPFFKIVYSIEQLGP